MGKSDQTTISSFFSPKSQKSSDDSGKRAASPIDLTGDDQPTANSNHPPSNKRRRLITEARSPARHSAFFFTQEPSDSRSNAGSSPSKASSNADKWRFHPNTFHDTLESPSILGTTEEEKARRKRRHETFKNKLLADNSLFLNPQHSADPDLDDESAALVETQTPEDSNSDTEAKFQSLRAKFKAKAGSKARKENSNEIGPSGQRYTPLENQIRALRAKHPGVLLMVEVGYKYRFFGEDAQIASKLLGIVAFTDRNFVVAGIPTHRRDIHLRKLLSQGYKIGIVEQTETAALKQAGDNRSAPFERKLTHLYTLTTYVDDLNSADEPGHMNVSSLMCIVEDGVTATSDQNPRFGVVIVCPSSGDVIWDDFADNPMRTELETRVSHSQPKEFLLPQEGQLSPATDKMLQYHLKSSSNTGFIRLERFQSNMTYSEAFAFVTQTHVISSEARLPVELAGLPKHVVIAIAHTMHYLSPFNLANVFSQARFFTRFTSRHHMLLNANTLTNLEIYPNGFAAKGSLLWFLDKTTTRFGSRLLRNWIGRPLKDKTLLRSRLDAVEEIISDHTPVITRLRELLKGLPDLSKGLCRIQYGKCTPPELALLLSVLSKISAKFDPWISPEQTGLKSPLLQNIVYSLPKLHQPLQGILKDLDLKKAREGKLMELWRNPERYPAVDEAATLVCVVETELEDHLRTIRKDIRRPSLKWTVALNEEYLVEIRKSDRIPIPDDWQLLSSTKTVRRYRPPEVSRKVRERAQYKEVLESEAKKAFRSFLEYIVLTCYTAMREAITQLSIADCLFSLAALASRENYSRPEFTDEDGIELLSGRHPMLEALRDAPFVPNDVHLGEMGGSRHLVITGGNTGGKSCTARMVALIVTMAQIGSYVPAKLLRMGIVDGVLTRMGASDELARGRSTFMVEMAETSDIVRLATARSLVILDELGRGTSTFDGMALAAAVLQHLIQVVDCKTMFISHYHALADDLGKQFPLALKNAHMAFTEESKIDGSRDLAFLYKLTEGVATESFGIECARLAGIDDKIIFVAMQRARHMRGIVEGRTQLNRFQTFLKLTKEATEESRQQRTATFRVMDDLAHRAILHSLT